MFRTQRFQNEADCDRCGWRLERGPGHWLGGTEVNMLLTFTTALVVAGPLVYWFGFGVPVVIAATVVTLGASLGLYRRTRCLFFALDHLIDPVPDGADGGGPGGSGGDDPPSPMPAPPADAPVVPGAEAWTDDALAPRELVPGVDAPFEPSRTRPDRARPSAPRR